MQNTDAGVVTTVNELAANLNVDYPTAAGLVKLMVSKGAAKETGKRPTATGKGKPATVYLLNHSFTIEFATAPKSKTAPAKASADAPKVTKVAKDKPAAAPKATKVAKPAVAKPAATTEPAAEPVEVPVQAA